MSATASLATESTGQFALGRLDRCRRPTPHRSRHRDGAVPAKEWHHVVVHHPDASILLNLSESVEADGRSIVRAVVMVHHAGGWVSESLTAEAGEATINPLTLDLRIGNRARLRWADGRYEVRLDCARLRLDLSLTPISGPQLLSGGVLSNDERISWLIVPRLLATGSLHCDDVAVELFEAPSYHDHNWGHFAWGGDFGWEWASGTAADWSFTASRLLDRTRTRVSAQYLHVEDDTTSATFRDAEITVEHIGRLGPVVAPVVPGVMRLVTPVSLEDIPQVMIWRARRRDQAVEITVTPTSVARLVIPSDVDATRVVVLAEVFADVHLEATLGDHRRTSSGPGILELLR